MYVFLVVVETVVITPFGTFCTHFINSVSQIEGLISAVVHKTNLTGHNLIWKFQNKPISFRL